MGHHLVIPVVVNSDPTPMLRNSRSQDATVLRAASKWRLGAEFRGRDSAVMAMALTYNLLFLWDEKEPINGL